MHTSSGQETDTSILQGLLKVSELGDDKYLIFVKEKLFKGKI